MGASWDRYERNEVLHIAANLTSLRLDPDNVVRHAKVLTDWLAGAPTDDDRKDRFAALRRADRNRGLDALSDTVRATDDDPALLITEAETYYAFLKGA